jgi:hypothetical protein
LKLRCGIGASQKRRSNKEKPMEISQCGAGLRVRDKETNKQATIKSSDRGRGLVEIEFDSGGMAKVHPRRLDPLGDAPPPSRAAAKEPMHDCPRCAAKFPLAESTCPACGYQFKPPQSGGMPLLVKILIVLAFAGGAGWAVWKYVLDEKLPF